MYHFAFCRVAFWALSCCLWALSYTLILCKFIFDCHTIVLLLLEYRWVSQNSNIFLVLPSNSVLRRHLHRRRRFASASCTFASICEKFSVTVWKRPKRLRPRKREPAHNQTVNRQKPTQKRSNIAQETEGWKGELTNEQTNEKETAAKAGRHSSLHHSGEFFVLVRRRICRFFLSSCRVAVAGTGYAIDYVGHGV